MPKASKKKNGHESGVGGTPKSWRLLIPTTTAALVLPSGWCRLCHIQGGHWPTAWKTWKIREFESGQGKYLLACGVLLRV